MYLLAKALDPPEIFVTVTCPLVAIFKFTIASLYLSIAIPLNAVEGLKPNGNVKRISPLTAPVNPYTVPLIVNT
jgi:hypothetical protein